MDSLMLCVGECWVYDCKLKVHLAKNKSEPRDENERKKGSAKAKCQPIIFYHNMGARLFAFYAVNSANFNN